MSLMSRVVFFSFFEVGDRRGLVKNAWKANDTTHTDSLGRTNRVRVVLFVFLILFVGAYFVGKNNSMVFGLC